MCVEEVKHLIKERISQKTEGMLQQQELKEYCDKQVVQKDNVEAEMLEEGDRLTKVLIMKEKLEFENHEIEAMAEDKRDEGHLLEIDDNFRDL